MLRRGNDGIVVEKKASCGLRPLLQIADGKKIKELLNIDPSGTGLRFLEVGTGPEVLRIIC